MDGSGPGRAAAVGGFFALRTGGGPPGGAAPLARLYAGDTAPLAARTAAVGARLGTGEARVAASVAFLGLASRLWSVALAPAVLDGELPDLAPELLHWDPGPSAPGELWLAPGTRRPLPAQAADALDALVLDAHLVPLVRATRTVARVSERLLWGNAASALAGAADQLARWCLRHGDAAGAARTRAAAATVLAAPLLRTGGTLTPGGYRRRTCCLYYRVPAGGLCGDCCFTSPPGR
ncbi:(2Fe-2S)-binding protein [Streptomyces sp. TRM 70351]|uniref:(2Fe-2S)-binding protein n=1 Tax=Streptomyces sp. TRM 70351 TaxID=3116552 RepID=UPI002E7C4EBF|nr:(2Fe-2S)-binding protein [Streptomyces sp. TRM 70351]MEE1927038.1 (2Fe-2S)-binding protein [Streptomyces sp. TRM 70351]